MGKKRNWTQEEYTILKDSWGETSISTIAKKLNRTPNAIKVKAQRLGLGPHRENGAKVSFSQLLKEIGQFKNYTYIKKMLIRNGFPFKTQKIESNSFLMVDIDDFWKWTEQHKNIINFADFEELALGKEPVRVFVKRNFFKTGDFLHFL